MRVQQDEIIPHHASIGPVVETKPNKWGWIEEKSQWGFTPEGNMILDWIQVKMMRDLDNMIINEMANKRKNRFPNWWYDI